MSDYMNNAAQDMHSNAPVTAHDVLKHMDIDAVKAELASLREQFDKVKVNVADKAAKVDSHIHSRPYPYVLSALGVGLVAGYLLKRS